MRHKLLLFILVVLFGAVLFLFGYKTLEKPWQPASKNEVTQDTVLPELTKPRVTIIDPVRGKKNAPITIIEYADYLCSFCTELEPVIEQTLAAYPEKVRLVWKDFPNEALHPDAVRSAEAARCAGEKGRYWELHDILLTRADVFGLRPLEDWASMAGVDRTFMQECLASGRYRPHINETVREALALKLTGAPSLFINDRPFEGRTFLEFKNAIEPLLK